MIRRKPTLRQRLDAAEAELARRRDADRSHTLTIPIKLDHAAATAELDDLIVKAREFKRLVDELRAAVTVTIVRVRSAADDVENLLES